MIHFYILGVVIILFGYLLLKYLGGDFTVINEIIID